MNGRWRSSARKPRRGGLDAVLLRRLPGDSPVSRLWIGTKLISLAAVTLATALNTGWAQVIALAVLTVVTVAAARVPWRAWPRVPPWFWATIAIGYLFALAGEGGAAYLRFVVLSLLFVVLALVIAWTTELGDLDPALRKLGAPARKIGLPIDEWALSTVLAVRCLPLVLDEGRTVFAARRQRPVTHNSAGVVDAIIDTVAAAMAASVRRATDLGEVIALRGGVPAPVATRIRLAAADYLALVLSLVVSVVPSLLW